MQLSGCIMESGRNLAVDDEYQSFTCIAQLILRTLSLTNFQSKADTPVCSKSESYPYLRNSSIESQESLPQEYYHLKFPSRYLSVINYQNAVRRCPGSFQ